MLHDTTFKATHAHGVCLRVCVHPASSGRSGQVVGVAQGDRRAPAVAGAQGDRRPPAGGVVGEDVRRAIEEVRRRAVAPARLARPASAAVRRPTGGGASRVARPLRNTNESGRLRNV